MSHQPRSSLSQWLAGGEGASRAALATPAARSPSDSLVYSNSKQLLAFGHIHICKNLKFCRGVYPLAGHTYLVQRKRFFNLCSPSSFFFYVSTLRNSLQPLSVLFLCAPDKDITIRVEECKPKRHCSNSCCPSQPLTVR